MNLHHQFPLPILLVEMSEAAWRRMKDRFRQQETMILSCCECNPGHEYLKDATGLYLCLACGRYWGNESTANLVKLRKEYNFAVKSLS